MITEGLSEALTSYVTMKKVVKLGPNANIQKIVKKGDRIKTSEPLLVFEQSFEDASANALLDRLGQDFGEAIDEFSKTTITSIYTGEVVDIKI